MDRLKISTSDITHLMVGNQWIAVVPGSAGTSETRLDDMGDDAGSLGTVLAATLEDQSSGENGCDTIAVPLVAVQAVRFDDGRAKRNA